MENFRFKRVVVQEQKIEEYFFVNAETEEEALEMLEENEYDYYDSEEILDVLETTVVRDFFTK